MKNKIRQKNSEPKAIVYDDYMGIPYAVTIVGNQPLVTTPGEPFLPLKEFSDSEGIGFYYLCGAGDKVGALALAKMLGVALENPEDKVDEVLRHRVDSLKRLGVTLDVKDEPLVMELEIISNENFSLRHGEFSAVCHLDGNFFEKVFDIDAFDSKENAEEWVSYFFDMLKELGIEFRIIRK